MILPLFFFKLKEYETKFNKKISFVKEYYNIRKLSRRSSADKIMTTREKRVVMINVLALSSPSFSFP